MQHVHPHRRSKKLSRSGVEPDPEPKGIHLCDRYTNGSVHAPVGRVSPMTPGPPMTTVVRRFHATRSPRSRWRRRSCNLSLRGDRSDPAAYATAQTRSSNACLGAHPFVPTDEVHQLCHLTTADRPDSSRSGEDGAHQHDLPTRANPSRRLPSSWWRERAHGKNTIRSVRSDSTRCRLLNGSLPNNPRKILRCLSRSRQRYSFAFAHGRDFIFEGARVGLSPIRNFDGIGTLTRSVVEDAHWKVDDADPAPESVFDRDERRILLNHHGKHGARVTSHPHQLSPGVVGVRAIVIAVAFDVVVGCGTVAGVVENFEHRGVASGRENRTTIRARRPGVARIVSSECATTSFVGVHAHEFANARAAHLVPARRRSNVGALFRAQATLFRRGFQIVSFRVHLRVLI